MVHSLLTLSFLVSFNFRCLVFDGVTHFWCVRLCVYSIFLNFGVNMINILQYISVNYHLSVFTKQQLSLIVSLCSYQYTQRYGSLIAFIDAYRQVLLLAPLFISFTLLWAVLLYILFLIYLIIVRFCRLILYDSNFYVPLFFGVFGIIGTRSCVSINVMIKSFSLLSLRYRGTTTY